MTEGSHLLIDDVSTHYSSEPFRPLQKDLDESFSELLEMKQSIDAQFGEEPDNLPPTNPQDYGFMDIMDVAVRAEIDNTLSS